MATFHCRNCRYEFQLRTDKTPKSCPYCGKAGAVVTDKSAAALLKEVEEAFKN